MSLRSKAFTAQKIIIFIRYFACPKICQLELEQLPLKCGFSVFFIAINISAFIAIAPATVANVDCNPSYDVASSTPCFTACNVAAGQTLVPGWTMDHISTLFVPSLTLMCTKTAPKYIRFMAKAGMCMAQCTSDDPELFHNEFAGSCAWWAVHKNDTCSA